jgi:hypothetical protein
LNERNKFIIDLEVVKGEALVENEDMREAQITSSQNWMKSNNTMTI